MNIIVLIKQVPATESIIQVNEDGVSLQTKTLKMVMNPYDEFAVEEALRLREAHGGVVTLISVGPKKAAEIIRTGMAMGADNGILIESDSIGFIDGPTVAAMLANLIQTVSFDLIIAGQRAVDDDGYYVGTAVAELLAIPSIPLVIHQTVTGGKIRCRCSVEGGLLEVEAALPALFTTQKGLNEPRYASLPGIMKAKKKPLEIKTPADMGIDPNLTAKPKMPILSIRPAPTRTGGRMIEGDDAAAKAAELARLLREEKKII